MTDDRPTASVAPPVDPVRVIADLVWLSDECDRRCLYECSKWSREMMSHMSEAHFSAYAESPFAKFSTTAPATRHSVQIDFVRSLIFNREYSRAKFFLKCADMTDPTEAFLYYFSWYMVSVQKRVEADASNAERLEPYRDLELRDLREQFETFRKKSPQVFDSFLHYLRGLIMKDCDAKEVARDCFYEAITLEPRCWLAWDALSKLSDIFYSVKVEKLDVATTWQCTLYTAETFFRLQHFLCANDKYAHLAEVLGPSPYIMCQMATAQSDLQEHDSAIASFQRIRETDPYRVEHMNKFSDSLYIRQNIVELANLAKFFYGNNKFAWETCCIVANYYSARGGAEGHDTAQVFLKRALRMNPTNTAIWVLLGHELMELTRNQSAVLAYRRAVCTCDYRPERPNGLLFVEWTMSLISLPVNTKVSLFSAAIDPLCYQAWYGLGQLYEILKLPAMALYYYQQAHKCKPADSRMLIALGVILTRLNRISDAEKCFKKAFQIGDMEGNALTHLARLYESQKDMATAAKAYEAYLGFYNEESVGDFEQLAEANQFLAKYYLGLDELDMSYNYAQKCLNYNTSKEEGYRVLRAIQNRRAVDKAKPSTSGISPKKATTRRRVPTADTTAMTSLTTETPATRRRRRSSTATADSSAMNVDVDDSTLESSETKAESSRQRLVSTETVTDDDETEEDQQDEDDDDNMHTSDDDDLEITY